MCIRDRGKDKDEKQSQKSKKVFQVLVRHRMRHGRKCLKKGSQSGLLASTHDVTKPAKHCAKIIQGLSYQSDNKKKLMLKRLARQVAAQRSSV